MLLFESFNEIHKLCQEYLIENYTINPDGTIDVDEDVRLSWYELKILPLKFRNVTGNFDCDGNYLTTLEGAPESIGGDFDCSDNKLTKLKGAPKSVGGSFYCGSNKLLTLKGAPQSVDGDFICSNNKLKTLEGSPQSIGGYFDCTVNKLTTLEYAPSVVSNFYCWRNPLDSVRGLFPDDITFHKLAMEWEFFAGGNKIYKHRFLEAMIDIGKKRIPKSIPGYEYI